MTISISEIDGKMITEHCDNRRKTFPPERGVWPTAINNQITIINIVAMERRPEKSAGELRHFCGKIALIFLDFLIRFVSKQNEYIKPPKTQLKVVYLY
ncbi:MAG: hypothetical protein GQ527_02930 [Bacteroidales bacterium]|nr:hypothetical protein [Bacteroidales bacterium]